MTDMLLISSVIVSSKMGKIFIGPPNVATMKSINLEKRGYIYEQETNRTYDFRWLWIE